MLFINQLQNTCFLSDEVRKEVNAMFANERRKVNERYKEYDGVYLGRYTQWFVGFFFCLGFFGFCAVITMLIAKHYGT